MKRKNKNRIFSLLLSAALVWACLPASTLRAAEPGADTKAAAQEAEIQNPSATAETTAPEPEIIRLATAEDFIAFAENCTIDSWSVNKQVVLLNDISLSGTDFETIPVFAGAFDGQGHTVSGYRSTQQEYVSGLFRYIEKDGLVENLTLSGTVTGADENTCLGGICGINYGTIKNCGFQGNIEGRDTVGSIAAFNEITGTITHCNTSGHVSGYYTTGGIAGENHGVISYCSNRADINDDTAWVETEDEMGTGVFFSIHVSEEQTDLYSGVDTGGIAGYSNGLISNCFNYGTVGYEHTGYNIGGIAGRQAGVVSLCSNSGTVYGRKDVGGIVGQMEPYIEVDEAESLRNAVNKLHDLINKTLTDCQAGSDAVKTDFDSLNAYGDGVLEKGSALADQMTRFTNANLAQIQNIADRIDYIADMLPGVMDSVSYAGDSLSQVNQMIGRLSNDFDISGRMEGHPYRETDYRRISLLSSVGGQLSCNSSDPAAGEEVIVTVTPQEGYRLKKDTLKVTDASGAEISFTESNADDTGKGTYTFLMPESNVKVEASFEASPGMGGGTEVILQSNLSGTADCAIDEDSHTATLTVTPDTSYILGDISAHDETDTALTLSRLSGEDNTYSLDISSATSPITVTITFEKQNQQQVVSASTEYLKTSLDRLQSASDRTNSIIESINHILLDDDGNPKDHLSPDEQEQINSLSLELMDSLGDMSDSAASMLSSLSSISHVLSPYVSQAAKDAQEDIGQATEAVQEMVDYLKSATMEVRGMTDYVNAQPDIVFTPLGEEFALSRQELHQQLLGISDSLKSLNENASGYSTLLTEDLIAVNDQLNVVFNLLTNHLTDHEELNIEELYEEVAEEDIASITTGRVDSCTNSGIIRGDINIGGVAGSMSVDEEDPEDSAAGNLDYGIGRRFITKCIINSCVNKGYITAKKDGAGGVVGYMKHGIVMDSEGYGSVESTEGDFVGGICGESHTIIRNCYSLCSVSGGKNTGGIAGYADTLQNCCTISDVTSRSGGKTGAVAGQLTSYDNMLEGEDGEAPKVYGNYYVGDDLFGIDNISYVGIAEPVTYRELLTVENLPNEFWHLKVIYRIEDTYLGSQEVKYGESLACLNYPDIPEREGYYGVWPDYSDRVMEGNLVIDGEYRDNVTVVESGDGDLENSYALVEQTFTEDTVLKVSISEKAAPAEANGHPYVMYDVSLENGGISDGDTFAIRLLNPYDKAEVWGFTREGWFLLDSKVRGRYLQVTMTGPKQTFCIVNRKTRLLPLLGASAAILLLSAVLLFTGRRAYRRKKK